MLSLKYLCVIVFQYIAVLFNLAWFNLIATWRNPQTFRTETPTYLISHNFSPITNKNIILIPV